MITPSTIDHVLALLLAMGPPLRGNAKDPSDRHVVVALWGLTALIVLLLINFFVGLLTNLGLL